jgi:hypothetical protein
VGSDDSSVGAPDPLKSPSYGPTPAALLPGRHRALHRRWQRVGADAVAGGAAGGVGRIHKRRVSVQSHCDTVQSVVYEG